MSVVAWKLRLSYAVTFNELITAQLFIVLLLRGHLRQQQYWTTRLPAILLLILHCNASFSIDNATVLQQSVIPHLLLLLPLSFLLLLMLSFAQQVVCEPISRGARNSPFVFCIFLLLFTSMFSLADGLEYSSSQRTENRTPARKSKVIKKNTFKLLFALESYLAT